MRHAIASRMDANWKSCSLHIRVCGPCAISRSHAISSDASRFSSLHTNPEGVNIQYNTGITPRNSQSYAYLRVDVITILTACIYIVVSHFFSGITQYAWTTSASNTSEGWCLRQYNYRYQETLFTLA